ncbi:conjugal transfer protein TraX [Pseudomonas sp. W2-17]|uniref:conjugal transfer protein TraX n=1 Tax=Pseudomonas sp. W2-17 TaxID=3058039 RepID=UPI0034E0D210
MENKHQHSNDASAGSDDQHPAGPGLGRRVGKVGLAIINPFSDLAVIYRTGIKPLGVKMGVLHEQVARLRALRKNTSSESLTWAQAVACTGQSVEQLQAGFRRLRRIWWLLMVGISPVAVFLLLNILITASSLPVQTLLRAIAVDAALVTLAMLSVAKVLNNDYRLWQLASRRVSIEEQGTFQDYAAEHRIWRQVVTPFTLY